MLSPILNIDYYGTRLSEIPELTDKEKELYKEMVDMCDGIIMPGGYRMLILMNIFLNIYKNMSNKEEK